MFSSRAKRRKLSAASHPSLLSIVQDRVELDTVVHTWDILPFELLLRVFLLLPPDDKRNVALVCSRWYSALNIPLLWHDSWITLKPGLKSRSKRFWDFLRMRQYCNYYVCCFKSVQKNMVALKENLEQTIIGLKLCLPLNSIKSLEVITSFSSLQVLHLNVVPYFSMLQDPVCKLITKLVSLVELGLFRIWFDECNLDNFSHPRVQCLIIKYCKELTLEKTSVILGCFPSLKRLQILECSTYLITNKVEVPHPNVTHLTLSAMLICLYHNAAPLSILFTNLSYVNLSFSNICPCSLAGVLSTLPKLEELHLRKCDCNDFVISSLTCTQLKRVDLSHNPNLTLNGILSLSNLAKDNLKFLNLGYCIGLMNKRLIYNMHLLFPSLLCLDLSGWVMTDNLLVVLLGNATYLREITITKTSVNETVLSYGQTYRQTIIHYVA